MPLLLESIDSRPVEREKIICSRTKMMMTSIRERDWREERDSKVKGGGQNILCHPCNLSSNYVPLPQIP
jgi:predicted transcriptional regulator